MIVRKQGRRAVFATVALVVQSLGVAATGVSLACAGSARAQDLGAALAGKATQRTLRELEGKNYQRVQIRLVPPIGDASGGLFGMMLGGGAGPVGDMMEKVLSGVASPDADVYYTATETVAIAGETFLVAYQFPTARIDAASMQRMKTMDKAPNLKPMTADTVVGLVLLNIRQIASLTGFRPFDLKRELAESEATAKSLAEFGKDDAGSGEPSAPPRVETKPVPARAAPKKPATKPAPGA